MSVTLEMLQQAAVTRENEMLNHQVKENEANKTPQNSANLPKSRALKMHYLNPNCS